MPTSQLPTTFRKYVAITVLAVLLLVSAGCGDEEPEAGIRTVYVELRDGRFAPNTPTEKAVPADALLVLRVTSTDDGPYRFSVVSTKTAQTFKFTKPESRTITLDNLGPGGEASLILGGGRETIKLVSDR